MLYGSIPVTMNADINTTIFKRTIAVRHAFGMSADDVTFHPYWAPLNGIRLVHGRSVRASVLMRADKIMIVVVNSASSTSDVQVVLSDELLAKTYRGYRLRDCVAERDVVLTTATTRQGVVLPGRRCRLSLDGHGFTILLGEADRP